jgi:ATP-binding cassette subfamily F protein uup
MSLISVHALSKAFGSQPLFEQISFSIFPGDRIGLVGLNGCGKSTLLKILVGLEKQDEGAISLRPGLRIGYASQSPEFPPLPLEAVLMEQPAPGDEIERLTRARILLSKAQFPDFSQNAASLSGGWKKRLDIIRALMQEPDCLLLDEPTNHLDLESILWLEKFLMKERLSYMIVSHDRTFLDNVANKIIEINPCYPEGVFISQSGQQGGGMQSGVMNTFHTHKEAFLEAQAEQERSLTALLRNEIDWLKRSPKARTTKSQSRVQRTHELIGELAELKRRNKTTRVDIEFAASERETRKLLVANNLTKTLGNTLLFKGIDLTLSPGTRLGIVGRNGTGKTTLLKILAGQIPQDMGTIKYADNLKLVYFDQHREQIHPDISLRDALSPSDFVQYRGQSIHVNGWAKRFLFSPDRLGMPVGALSGGERARIFIARLMLEPADILFLDEPTNDLDIPTLEIIEESLREFPGAVVLISHDRSLMDQLCTQILGLGEAQPRFFADYHQWERTCLIPEPKKEKEATTKPAAAPSPSRAKKLSYQEQKELEGMANSIASVEAGMETLQQRLLTPDVQSDAQKSLQLYQQLAAAQEKLDALYARWQQLLDKSVRDTP